MKIPPAEAYPEETKMAIAYLMDRYETQTAFRDRALATMRQLLADAKIDPLRASRYRTASQAAYTRSENAARDARMVRRAVLALTGGTELPTKTKTHSWLAEAF